MKKVTKAWVEFAQRDLAAAEKLRDEDSLSNIVLYHCEQCVEKSVKAVFEEHSVRIPRVHVTLKLHTDIRSSVPTVPELATEDDLVFIDDVYLDTRYPGSLGLLPGGFPSRLETVRGLAIARAVLARVTEYLSSLLPST